MQLKSIDLCYILFISNIRSVAKIQNYKKNTKNLSTSFNGFFSVARKNLQITYMEQNEIINYIYDQINELGGNELLNDALLDAQSIEKHTEHNMTKGNAMSLIENYC